MNETQMKQVEMHKDFFDRCKFALDNGFYMEALLMEYAAIESRLEIILGVIGLPCSKYLEFELRKKINISNRIACLDHARKNSSIFQNSKLEKNFFKKLKKWTDTRNQYIHGLYKNELIYKQRMSDVKTIAEKGYEYCRLLYNEAQRVRRVCKKNPELLDGTIVCQSEKCTVYRPNP